MRALVLVALLMPALGFAKPKVVLDADRPVGPLLEKALKAKYAVTKAELAESPTGGDVKKACREAGGAIAVITARAGGGDLVTIMVLNGADGSPLATFRIKAGRKPPKALPKPDVKKLLEGLDEAKAPKKDDEKPKPPPEEKPAPEEKKPEESKPEPVAEKPPEEAKPEKKGRGKQPTEPPPPPKEEVRAQPPVVEEEPEPSTPKKKLMALRFGLGLKLFNRRFGYTDDLFDALSTYYLPLGPALAADLELYPAAFVTGGIPGNVGVLGSFDYAVGISSRAMDMTRYGTSAFNLRLALTLRVPVSILTVNPFVGYALQTYAITSSTGTKPNIPNVSYGGLRGGLRLNVQFVKFLALQLWFAAEAVLSKGELGTYFPHANAGGLDTGGGFTVALLDRLEVKAVMEYQRYWFSMNPNVGDTNIAGGALDVYVSGNLSIAFKF